MPRRTVCCNAMYCNAASGCQVVPRWSIMLLMRQLLPNKFSTTSLAEVNTWNKINQQPYWRSLQNEQIEATRSASATLDAWKGCERRPGAKLQAPAAQRIMLCKLWQKPWTEPRQVDFIQLLGRAFFARTCQKSCRMFAETRPHRVATRWQDDIAGDGLWGETTQHLFKYTHPLAGAYIQAPQDYTHTCTFAA